MPVSGDGGHLRDDPPQARTSVVKSKLYPKRGLATDSAPETEPLNLGTA